MRTKCAEIFAQLLDSSCIGGVNTAVKLMLKIDASYRNNVGGQNFLNSLYIFECYTAWHVLGLPTFCVGKHIPLVCCQLLHSLICIYYYLPSLKEGCYDMFPPMSVCLSVCPPDYSKSYGSIWIKFFDGVVHAPSG